MCVCARLCVCGTDVVVLCAGLPAGTEDVTAAAAHASLTSSVGDYPFARQQDCDLRLFDFEAFGGFGKEVRSTLREAANQLSNKLSHAQHLDEVTWTTKNWHGLQMQRLSVVLHTAVACGRR